MRGKVAGVVAAFFVIALLPVANAQDDNEMLRLFKAESITCNFDKGAVAEWEEGDVKVSAANFGKGGVVVYTSIDIDERGAVMTGVQGKNPVVVLLTAVGLTFVENTDVGNLIFTTIFNPPQVGGSYQAVTSRHVFSFVKPLPSQYHGICIIAE